MRHIKIRALQGMTERALDLGLVELRVLTGKSGRDRGVLTQIENLLPHHWIAHHRFAVAILADLLRELSRTIFRAKAMHHIEPGTLDKLVKSLGAAGGGFGVSMESAFLRGLRHQQAEIDRGGLACPLNAVQDRRIDLLRERWVRVDWGRHAPRR
jgi:hypothetical protein